MKKSIIKSNRIYIVLLSIFVLFIFSILVAKFLTPSLISFPFTSDTKIAPTKTIYVSGKAIRVELAQTPSEMRQGLSGVTRLTKDEGMLFVFPIKTKTSFWMKEMIIPLDIIWIADGRVVDLDQNVPIPSTKSLSDLPLYSASVPVNYVLEVNAGFVLENNVRIGDLVLIP